MAEASRGGWAWFPDCANGLFTASPQIRRIIDRSQLRFITPVSSQGECIFLCSLQSSILYRHILATRTLISYPFGFRSIVPSPDHIPTLGAVAHLTGSVIATSARARFGYCPVLRLKQSTNDKHVVRVTMYMGDSQR
jgi:hypothetical protein